MATRTELLRLRDQIGKASEGRDLLADKRAQLLDAFREVADTVLSQSDAFAETVAAAREALAWADGLHGPETVASASLGTPSELSLQARLRRVMGVPIPVIEHPPVRRARQRRGYSLAGSSAQIDEVASCFEDEVEMMIHMATEELRLRRLADELRKVSRRVNALEHVVIPGLEHRRRAVAATLDEREREERFRLERMKNRRRARRSA